ncbi:MAG: dephospho-CoA kinase [Phycisphaerae bacterium]
MSTPEAQPKKPVIGLTGSIGAGKTLVAGILSELGCSVIHADELAHQILQEEAAKDFLRKNFGSEVFDSQGQADRRKIADIVFADSEKIRRLEGFIHPEVLSRQDRLIERFRADARVRAIVLEVPLLIESGLKHLCDWVIVVDTDLAIRQFRVGETRNWSREELARREKFFFSIYLKRSLADGIVYNNSTIEDCRQQVESIYSRIISSVSCQLA